jgi:uncharacterized SAM-binding protein YcdF (DUF218 family)
MDTLIFFWVYPPTWLCFFAVLSLIFFFKKYRVARNFCIVITLVLTVSVTPLGASIWLNSVPIVTGIDSVLCDDVDAKPAILLPGGVVFVGKKITLTSWSKARVESVSEYINDGKVSKLLIPGGVNFQGKLEADYLIESLSKRTSNSIMIESGKGSFSTYTNFIELLPMIDRKQEYYLFTSQWHLYRAFKVAQKLGLNVCPIKVAELNKTKNLIESPWRFKAAIREYLAIFYYYLQGKI